MKKEVRYILTEEQATCIGDIRTAKSDLERMANKIVSDNLNKVEEALPLEISDFMFGVATKLSFALNKLELEFD